MTDDDDDARRQLAETTLPTKEVPFAVDPEKANMPQGMRVPFPTAADDGDLPVDSALDAQVEAEVLRSYSEPPEPAAHPTHPTDGASGTPSTAADPSSSTHFAKSLRLSSSQLKALGLKKGANTVTFSVSSSYSGMATCSARIFLWSAEDHIVISDIDGTITKFAASEMPPFPSSADAVPFVSRAPGLTRSATCSTRSAATGLTSASQSSTPTLSTTATRSCT